MPAFHHQPPGTLTTPDVGTTHCPTRGHSKLLSGSCGHIPQETHAHDFPDFHRSQMEQGTGCPGKGPAGSCKYHICIAQFHREQLAGPIITLLRDKKDSGSTSVSITKAGPGPAVALNLIGSNFQGPAATH